jgi:hypothetical protein
MAQAVQSQGLQSDPASMMGLLNGAWAARLVHAAAELGIADHLADGEPDAASLALAKVP